MAKVLVFQHVAAEPLGTLDPMLRNRGHRIRYVNFHRDPDAEPDIARYDALIVLGVGALIALVLLIYLWAFLVYRLFLRAFPLQEGYIEPGSRAEFSESNSS